MWRIPRILLSIHLLLCFSSAQDLSGRVSTIDDKPIRGAVVRPSGMLFSTVTGDDGLFLLNDNRMKYFWSGEGRKVLFVVKDGYDVGVTIIDRGQTKVDFNLRPSSVQPATTPDCDGRERKGFRSDGHVVRVEFPKSMKLKKKSNFEYDSFTLTAKEGATEAVLHNWVGVYATTYPSTDLIVNSKTFSVSRSDLGLDWKGQKTDGTYWRHFGGAVGTIDTFVYETTSETLAKQLDQVIATMCIRK